MAVDLAQLMQATNTSGTKDETFYRETNQAFASIATAALSNTPESQIQAQEQQVAIQQRKNTIALDVIMQSHQKDQELYSTYQAEYKPREQDYTLLQQEREKNLKTITEIERDPKQNSIFHPIKSIIGSIKQSRAKDQNDAIIEEMNAINDGMGAATTNYIAAHQNNAEQLRFNLQTEVELKNANAMAAAQQEERAASMRYTDTQDDIQKLTIATSGLGGVTLSEQMAARKEKEQEATDQELAHFRSIETGTPYSTTITEAERPLLKRSLKAKSPEEQAANSIAAYRYIDHIGKGEGSTETPISFAQRQIVTTNDSDYARSIDKLTDGRYSEVANIGLELRVQKTAAQLRAGKLEGMDPKVAALLGSVKDIGDDAAQQLAIRNALSTSFQESYSEGVEFVKSQAAESVAPRDSLTGKAYANPALVSATLSDSTSLLAQIPQEYLSDKDPVQLRTRADVATKVSGMNGGDLQTHKFLAVNDFLKEQGIQDEATRVGILRNWLQFNVRGRYLQEGSYRNLFPVVTQGTAGKGEEFIIPIETAPTKGRSSIFGRKVPEMPAFRLDTVAGMALYLKAAESGAIAQAEAAATQERLNEAGQKTMTNLPYGK